MTKTSTMQRNPRMLQRLSGAQGYAIPAPALAMSPFGVDLCISSIEMDHGRIVSMAREYPPPKKR